MYAVFFAYRGYVWFHPLRGELIHRKQVWRIFRLQALGAYYSFHVSMNARQSSQLGKHGFGSFEFSRNTQSWTMLTTLYKVLLMRIHWKWSIKPIQKCQRWQLCVITGKLDCTTLNMVSRWGHSDSTLTPQMKSVQLPLVHCFAFWTLSYLLEFAYMYVFAGKEC